MDNIIILLMKILSFITGLLGGGTSLPGEIALKIRPNLLSKVSKGYRIVLVTGTNGKTTTCSQIVAAIKATGSRVINNSSGANMKPGIVSCLIKNYRFKKSDEQKFAVLEVDEAYLQHITEEIKPEIIAVTNIFRDQLDRYGEVDKTLKLIADGCAKTPDSTFVLNGDESLLYGFMEGSKRYYYGFRVTPDINAEGEMNAEGKFCRDCKGPYEYNFVTFNHLGDYLCPRCGKKRPPLALGVDKTPVLTADSSKVSFDGLEITIPLPGTYNIYNALCAATAAGALGVCGDDIKTGIESCGSKFGRQETVFIDGREVRIILVKNPAGCNEAINSVLPDESAVNLAFLLNDNYADGTDVSWIYDAHFERFTKMNYQNVLVGGTRCYDMAIRLKYAGLDTSRFHVSEDYDGILYSIRTHITGRVYLFTTYTAMTSFRKYLHKKKYIKKLWK